MLPINRTGGQQSIEIIDVPQHTLTKQHLKRQLQQYSIYSSDIPLHAHNLQIPQYNIVHDGNPCESAPRHKVDFKEYIKNDSASQLYPNWLKEALKSNIVCMTSFVLKCIYKALF